jgi:hypothetical protein
VSLLKNLNRILIISPEIEVFCMFVQSSMEKIQFSSKFPEKISFEWNFKFFFMCKAVNRKYLHVLIIENNGKN